MKIKGVRAWVRGKKTNTLKRLMRIVIRTKHPYGGRNAHRGIMADASLRWVK